MGVKQLLVSGVNHYWVAPETTTGMRANNYCFTFTHPIASRYTLGRHTLVRLRQIGIQLGIYVIVSIFTGKKL